MLATRRLFQLNRSNTIGFIGLGAMGRGMAANLLNKTFANQEGVYAPEKQKPAFVVYDAHTPAVDAFLNQHVRAYAGRDIIPASSPAGVAKLASTIVTMLPSSPQVQEVYLGENGLYDGVEGLEGSERKAETLFVDCTTLEQGVAKEVAEKMGTLGSAMIDAPVSGGVVGAQAGTLSFMVGGPKEAYERAQRFLTLMGARSIYCGGSGNGLAAKICNNLLLGISMAGTAEAMLLGQSLGLAPDLLASILNTSTGKCWASEINNPAPGALPKLKPPADRGYQGGFLSKLMAKDLNLAIAASKTTGTPLPVGGLTTTLYNTLSKHDDFANMDFSSVYEYLRIAQEGAKQTEGGDPFTGGRKQ
ncbi:BZ3500_MvSof-1268-A1-R1_Chr8-1g10020 [Microbotryum saponariae]|uniref:3-hydroxyisobutyrate dehydrogenase n=1 Tax=Microbotryum saponariae TaxID=289078 RepID=A0A2X0NPZ2_9BASI|nr:BZ3500_MvSof-1268-A1-R1_Chr8-1g10020 [Microbotryum saponariae]SDA08306.1 BZ3501_MvSof-1269-A2-R1_Chr8-1g09743 [Microbotryum saponariae]